MKRVLLDHCVPRPFGKLLADCQLSTAAAENWETLTNGELLSAAEAAGFEVLITADKNLRYQQKLALRKIAIIELPTNRLRLVMNCFTQVNTALQTIKAGDYFIVSE